MRTADAAIEVSGDLRARQSVLERSYVVLRGPDEDRDLSKRSPPPLRPSPLSECVAQFRHTRVLRQARKTRSARQCAHVRAAALQKTDGEKAGSDRYRRPARVAATRRRVFRVRDGAHVAVRNSHKRVRRAFTSVQRNSASASDSKGRREAAQGSTRPRGVRRGGKSFRCRGEQRGTVARAGIGHQRLDAIEQIGEIRPLRSNPASGPEATPANRSSCSVRARAFGKPGVLETGEK